MAESFISGSRIFIRGEGGLKYALQRSVYLINYYIKLSRMKFNQNESYKKVYNYHSVAIHTHP